MLWWIELAEPEPPTSQGSKLQRGAPWPCPYEWKGEKGRVSVPLPFLLPLRLVLFLEISEV